MLALAQAQPSGPERRGLPPRPGRPQAAPPPRPLPAWPRRLCRTSDWLCTCTYRPEPAGQARPSAGRLPCCSSSGCHAKARGWLLLRRRRGVDRPASAPRISGCYTWCSMTGSEAVRDEALALLATPRSLSSQSWTQCSRAVVTARQHEATRASTPRPCVQVLPHLAAKARRPMR